MRSVRRVVECIRRIAASKPFVESLCWLDLLADYERELLICRTAGC